MRLFMSTSSWHYKFYNSASSSYGFLELDIIWEELFYRVIASYDESSVA